jgi:hypothetical protein
VTPTKGSARAEEEVVQRFRLSAAAASATVHAMATPRSRQSARLRARRRRAQKRARRLALLAVVAALGVATLVLTAFGSGTPARQERAAPRSPVIATGTPSPSALATVSNVRIQLPVPQSAVTAIGYHGAADGALTLHPLGRQANEGLLARLWHRIVGNPVEDPVWYQLGSGPATEVLDVGAPIGTDVYAPVDGAVAAIRDHVIDGRVVGAMIDIRPTAAPSVIVSLSHLLPDPSLSVGSPVMAATSKLGTVAPMSEVEQQALAKFTNDRGDNVAVEVHPAASSLP